MLVICQEKSIRFLGTLRRARIERLIGWSYVRSQAAQRAAPETMRDEQPSNCQIGTAEDSPSANL